MTIKGNGKEVPAADGQGDYKLVVYKHKARAKVPVPRRAPAPAPSGQTSTLNDDENQLPDGKALSISKAQSPKKKLSGQVMDDVTDYHFDATQNKK